MITVEHLTKAFGPKLAVNDVTFTVNRGEVLGFLGPNGAGKSTTMRMVTGFIPPTSGSITVGGHDVLENPIPAKRMIGYLPENAPGYADMTVTGFLRVWLLARLRVLRPRSLRAEREWALIERWRAAVRAAAALDMDLAVEIVEAAGIVRGYGEVRRRLAAAFVRLLDEIAAPAIARDRAAGGDYARSRALVAEARRLLLTDENGIEAAVALAARPA